MKLADDHLNEALEEYNRKVYELETEGSGEELLEALVNRSTVLMLMGSTVASLSDIDNALDLIEDMSLNGVFPNIGSLVKLYENRGHICCSDDTEQMVEDYMKIIPHLTDLGNGARHYDRKSLITMCIECAEELIDCDYCENSLPFLEKGLLFIGGNYDSWSCNRRVAIRNLLGQAHMSMGLSDEALKDFTACINEASNMYLQNILEDEMELVLAFVYRGDICETVRNKNGMIADHESAADILERLNEEKKLEDINMLITLHRELASELSELDRDRESEKHLLRAMALGTPGLKDAIERMQQERIMPSRRGDGED